MLGGNLSACSDLLVERAPAVACADGALCLVCLICVSLWQRVRPGIAHSSKIDFIFIKSKSFYDNSYQRADKRWMS